MALFLCKWRGTVSEGDFYDVLDMTASPFVPGEPVWLAVSVNGGRGAVALVEDGEEQVIWFSQPGSSESCVAGWVPLGPMTVVRVKALVGNCTFAVRIVAADDGEFLREAVPFVAVP